jgi:hypothetical protein
MSKVALLSFLRNKEICGSRKEAVDAMKKQVSLKAQDGSIILSRYNGRNGVRTLAGVIYNDGIRKTLSLLKIEEVITDFETNNSNLNYGDLYKEYCNIKKDNP